MAYTLSWSLLETPTWTSNPCDILKDLIPFGFHDYNKLLELQMLFKLITKIIVYINYESLNLWESN